jgi:hypothetical protein
MGLLGWLLVALGIAACLLLIGMVWGAGRVFGFYEALARDDHARIADLSAENSQLRTDLTRRQNERLTSS